MNRFVLALLAIMVVSAVLQAGATTSTYAGNWQQVDGNWPLSNYNNVNDTTRGIYGTIWTVKFINTQGTTALTFTLYDEAGTSIYSTEVAAGATTYNRSVNYTTYGAITVGIQSNYTTNGTFPLTNLISWFKQDEGTDNTTSDQQSRNTLELGTNSSNRPGWTFGKIGNATTYNGSSTWARINQSNNTNITGFVNNTFSMAFYAQINGTNNNAYLFHQGDLSAGTNSSFYARIGYPSTANSSNLTVGMNRVASNASYNTTVDVGANNTTYLYTDSALNSTEYTASLLLFYNTSKEDRNTYNYSALTNANGTRKLTLNASIWNSSASATLLVNYSVGVLAITTGNSSGLIAGTGNTTIALDQDWLNTTSHNATLTVAYNFTTDTSTNTTVGVNGYNLSVNLSGTGFDTFTFNQTNISASTVIEFISNDTNTNISAYNLTYYVRPTVNVSVNGYNLGVLDNSTPDSFSFQQVGNLTASTTINFTPRYLATNITNITLNYTVRTLPVVTFNGVALGSLDAVANPYVFNISHHRIFAKNNLTYSVTTAGNNITNATLNYTAVRPVSTTYSLATNTTWDGDWDQFAVTYNDTNLSIYVNGILQAYTSYGILAPQKTMLPFYFGDGAGSSSWLYGKLDEIYLYNSTLTATQIAYTNTTPVSGGRASYTVISRQ